VIDRTGQVWRIIDYHDDPIVLVISTNMERRVHRVLVLDVGTPSRRSRWDVGDVKTYGEFADGVSQRIA